MEGRAGDNNGDSLIKRVTKMSSSFGLHHLKYHVPIFHSAYTVFHQVSTIRPYLDVQATQAEGMAAVDYFSRFDFLPTFRDGEVFFFFF